MASKGTDKSINNPFKRLKSQLVAATTRAPQQTATRSAKPAQVHSVHQVAALPVDDAALFLQANSGTLSLSGSQKRVAPKPAPRPNALLATDDAIALAELEDLVRGQGTFRVHESEEYHYGLAPGVNFALLDDLKRGRFAYEQCIDLHGMDRQTAHTEVGRFISQSRCRDGASCVLVVTGRGKSSPNGTSVLREALPRWLTRAPIRAHVLAFCTARAVDGGPGAFYVLLRRQGIKPFGEVVP